MDLTENEQRFCVEYAQDRNGTKAYQRVFPEASYGAASVAASRLLKKLTIVEEIKALRNSYRRQARISATRVLRELEAIAHFDPADVFEDVDGSPSPRPWRDIPPVTRRVISKVKIKRRRLCAGPKSSDDKTCWEVEEVEYSFCSKIEALDKLCRHLGITKDGAALEQLLKVIEERPEDHGGPARPTAPITTDPAPNGDQDFTTRPAHGWQHRFGHGAGSAAELN